MGEPSLFPGPFPDSPALRRKDSAKEGVAAPGLGVPQILEEGATFLEVKVSPIELSCHPLSTHQHQVTI